MSFAYGGGDDVAWVEVPFNDKYPDPPKGRNKHGTGFKFVHCIKEEMQNYDVSKIKIAFVIVQKETEKALAKEQLDKMGIVSQFITNFTLRKKLTSERPALGVYTNILR